MRSQPPALVSQTPVAEKLKMERKVGGGKEVLVARMADGVAFSIHSRALNAMGPDVTLGNQGDCIIFAPTDDSCGKVPAEGLIK
jgi:hypothetical protein